MPLLPLNLAAIGEARAGLAKQRGEQRSVSAQHAQANAELQRLRRAGADARTLVQQEQAVARLAEAARGTEKNARASLTSIRNLAEELRTGRDPADMVQALDASHPVLLMPVAIQTRYDDATTQLMIRLYPDSLHGFTHDPGLTPNEIDEGKRYWTQRFAVPDDAPSPWLQIARLFGPQRAAYVVQATTPTNVVQIGADEAPVFDDAAIPQSAPGSQQVYAQVLPNRFVAIGLRGGQEIFRKWGAPVADQLALSPLFDPLLAEGQDPDTFDPFADDRAWMVDYPAAVAAGMGITITQADLKAGALMTHGVERLVVLGVDWTQTPDGAAALVASLFDNHLHADGLKFVAQGTPTNNTAATRAGFTANGADVVEALDPAQAAANSQAVADELASAGARMQLLLGLPPSGFDAGLVPGATLLEGASAGHMLNALWNATLGYTLRFFWNPIDSGQTLIEDSAIEQLRAFGVRFLRPSGPLSALRVGKTPYGLLPVCARGYQPKANSALERELLEAITWFRSHWELAQGTVPTLRDPKAESLHQVLAMQPWAQAKRFWQVAGPAAVKNYPDIEPFAAWQGLFLTLLVQSLLGKQPFSTQAPFLATCAVRPKPHSLDAVPWVQRDPDHPQQELPAERTLTPNYIAQLLQLLSQPSAQVRAQITAMQDADSLLAAMLAFAADEEMLQSGRGLFLKHVLERTTLSAALKAEATRLRPAEYIGVDVATTMGDQFDLGHANAVLGLKLEGTIGDAPTVEAYIGSHFGQLAINWPEQLQNIAKFSDSLDYLKDRTAGELGHAFRTTLDLYAHRLDAWITALATKRLDEMREAAPEGLHIGAFGVVEDLLPDSVRPADQAADSYGYVHAPSLQQAATAAILRSAHVANRQAAAGAFDLDLRSHRVKRARRLLEGIANGQSMAALLGYRFERGLRDAALSQHILELRRAYPLMPAGDQAGDEAKEAISARNVIDGVRLIHEYQTQGIGPVLAATSPPLVLSLEDQGKVAKIIDDLLDQMDSVSDLLIAESVFQVAGGNMNGAGAAMQSLDKQERPPDTRVMDTPHSTRGYTQRVVVALQSTALGPWAGVADDDLAAQVEPRLNAWLAGLLGDPASYVFGAKLMNAVLDDAEPPRIVGWADAGETLEVGLDDLGLSPLALVLGSEARQGSGQSEVQERIGAALSAQARALPGAVPERQAVVLQAESPRDGKLGLVAFESFAWLLRRLLEKARPLRRMDMVRAEDGVEAEAILTDGEFAGVDLADLKARLDAAEVPALAAIADLADAIAPVPLDEQGFVDLAPNAPERAALLADLHTALAQARQLGWRSALPSERVAAASAEGERVSPADTLELAYARAKALLAEVQGRLDAAPPPQAGDPLARQAQAALDRIAAILGKAFPVLPQFNLGAYAPDAAATLADRASLLGGDELAISGWLPKLGCVREATGLLADVLTAAEAMGQFGTPQDCKLLQFPRDAAARWAALPPAPKQDLRGTVAVVAHAPGALAGLAPADTLAGLFIDEWSETIPTDHETTGLGFHFDAPGARPPQSMLLAVPADPDADCWTLDALLATVNEAMSLARLRAVRPQDLAGLGLMLPGIFLSNNFKRDVPSVDFAAMLEKNLSVLRAVGGQASENSFMKIAAGTLTAFE
ncbi:hypothetical protein [Ideonella sp.]|uniref:hypothetical protein n=1 Tax=Ideonella sp. TaxID=1929293 RepID=UPI002B4787BF|nr:hypothetical protein [Ideonella sp.]HJV70076.1 hypothetical protein [Ideonella sp.]